MINVLTSWDDIIRSVRRLNSLQCGYHSDVFKNWDLLQIADILSDYDKAARIFDAGCSETRCSVLRFLSKSGFHNLIGMDLRIKFEDRLEQFLPIVQEGKVKLPFKLKRGDITKTNFADSSFDLIVCLSVIEHGIGIESFFEEMSRLLRPNGKLYVSTDYWPQKISTSKRGHWGLRWSIFSYEEIISLIDIALKYNLITKITTPLEAVQPMIEWSGEKYTFISMIFQKITK